MLSVMKVAEVFEGDFCCAMECIDRDTAICFLFTNVNNFQFNIGVANVYFENKDIDAKSSSRASVMASQKVQESKKAQSLGEMAAAMHIPQEVEPVRSDEERYMDINDLMDVEDERQKQKKLKREKFYHEVDQEEFF